MNDQSSTPDSVPVGSKSVVAPVAGVEPVNTRDWTQDFAHENGNYLCGCSDCGCTFRGYKRRVVCNICASLATLRARVAELEKERDEVVKIRSVVAATGLGEDEGSTLGMVVGICDLAVDRVKRCDQLTADLSTARAEVEKYREGFVKAYRESNELRAELQSAKEALEDIANMPEYDQDDAHRLRHKARKALGGQDSQNHEQ